MRISIYDVEIGDLWQIQSQFYLVLGFKQIENPDNRKTQRITAIVFDMQYNFPRECLFLEQNWILVARPQISGIL